MTSIDSPSVYASERSSEKVVSRLHRDEPGPRDVQQLRPREAPIAAPIALSSCTTGVEDGSRGSTVLWLTITGSSSAPPPSGSSRCEPIEVDPQGVRVVVAPAAVVAEGVRVLRRCLHGLAENEPAVAATPGDVPALAIGLGPEHDLHQERDPLPRQVGGDPRIDGRAEVVGVGDHRVPESHAHAARRAYRSRAALRRRRRAPAGTTRARVTPANSPARASPRRASGPCSGGSPARARRPAAPDGRRAPRASHRASRRCSSARAAGATPYRRRSASV